MEATQEQLEALKAQYEELRRKVFGKSSEKMPPMDREVRRGHKSDPKRRQQSRRANAELKRLLGKYPA